MKQDIALDKIYYDRWKIVIGSRLWRLYLRWAYKTCIGDLRRLYVYPDFNRQNFTALLCGVGNETTADEFIRFVIAKNAKANIVIIDFGKTQIDSVIQLVQSRFASSNITVKKINALELLSFLSINSVDWIETDGFLEFFDKQNLESLLIIWRKLLKEDGYITLREPASNGQIGAWIDHLRVRIAKKWLGVTIYRHTQNELENLLHEQQFKFVSKNTLVPTFRRYALAKDL